MSKILEERMYEMINDTVAYGKNKYAKYLESAKAAVPNLSPIMEYNIVKSLAVLETQIRKTFGSKQLKSFTEATTKPSDVDSFINYAFDLVTAMLPANPIEEFATTQSIDKRVGEVFFMDIIKSSTKGSHTSGDDYLSAQTGPKTGKDYSSEEVDIEEMYDGDGTTLSFSGYSLMWRPIRPYDASNPHSGCTISYTIGSVDFTVTDNGSGVFIDAVNLDSGTINYTTGAIALTFATAKAPDNLTKISANYWQDSARDDVSQNAIVTLKMTSSFLTAKRRFLNTKWMIDTAIMLQKEHGADVEKEFVEKVLSGVMNEIAIEMADRLYVDATANSGAITEFDKTPPASVIPYIDHRREILGVVGGMGTDIEEGVRKITANFVIVGKDMAKVVKGLPDNMFEPVKYADKTPVGMHVIGVLDNQYKVIQNFDFANDKFLVGSKGPDWLTTGAIYAPFIPLMITPTNWQENGDHWRSLLTWYAIKTINGGFYCKGKVIAT